MMPIRAFLIEVVTSYRVRNGQNAEKKMQTEMREGLQLQPALLPLTFTTLPATNPNTNTEPTWHNTTSSRDANGLAANPKDLSAKQMTKSVAADICSFVSNTCMQHAEENLCTDLLQAPTAKI